ncbi:SusC/RagA family TonB-linked outer membrane protein [Fodinibius sp. AD559]|uniref:SusC/RagA family TonB-linked outer membrane protein n=1 Tax=Fodinibius sp. AD559 TaxID=3424179 RepID=UPI004046B21E
MKLKVLSLLVCAFGFLFVSSAVAQDVTVSGTVVAAEDGEPLPGVTVMLQGTNRGTATGPDGTYEIDAPSDGVLRFSFVGYVQQEIPINGRSTIDVEMETDVAELGDVVVTGYGEYSSRNFTGSVSQVSSDDFEDIPVTSIDQAMEGSITGANISASSGTPGAVQDVRIRGISSINAGTSPLYVIDGVPVVSGDDNVASTATSSFGLMATLSPSDIKSITVLKDAASTAPYGARGSNGVIVIQTKSGSAGDVTYTVDVKRGWSNRAVEGPGAMNAQQWAEWSAEAYQNAGLNYPPSVFWDQEGTGTDWGDVVTNDNAVTQQYNLSAQGGNEQTQFYVSGGLFEQAGAYIGSELDRYSGKFNFNHEFDERVTFTNNFTGSFVEQDGVLEGAGYFGSPVLAEYFIPPTSEAFNEDGSPKIENFGTSIFNPVYTQNNDIDRKRNSRVINNSTLDIQILENLSFTSNFSLDYILTEEKYYDNLNYGDGADIGGAVDDIMTRNLNYVWRNNLNYTFQPKEDHVFDVRLISESQKNHQYYMEAYGERVAYENLYNLNTTASPQFVGGSTTDWAVQSFTGLVNYTFNDKIITDLSLRREGNSRFSEEQRWGTFWSVGVGYILSEEEFIQNIDWLSYLKLRTSYGVTGNADIGLNNYQRLVGFGAYNGRPNIQLSQLGNPDLTWEKANSLDIALEFELIDRIDGSVTFFRKDGTDLLFNVPLSRTTGHTSQVINGGELYNQGFEMELSANIVNTRDVSWNLGGNLTLIKNEVTDLPLDLNGDPIELTTGTRYRGVEGYAVDSWYMREWAGVDPENGDPLWYMDDGNGGRTTTNTYNEADRYYQGANAQPNQFGGINTRINVFGFYAQANLSFSFDYKIYDNWAFYMRSDGRVAGAFGQYETALDYWTPENTDAQNPKPIAGGNNNAYNTSSRYLYDGDHIRLKSLNVGYNIPTQYLENVGLKSATVYFTGRNLWTHMFDEELQYDPEQKADGFTDLSAQPMRTLTFGVKANF